MERITLKVDDVDITPNPNALKFIINETLLQKEQRHYKSKYEAELDPLARGVFGIEGVISVFYAGNFITIEKRPDIDWGNIQKSFLEFIQYFDKTTIPKEPEIKLLSPQEQNELFRKINALLDQRVRPALAGDGGGLEVVSLVDRKLTIRYQGACGSCPSAIRGTLVAIENLLRKEIDPNIEVASVI